MILCNAGSFSATDGSLSALKCLPSVRVVGESSGGGSGAARLFALQHSRIICRVSSFQANGKLFDGNGVEVDIRVLPEVGDFLGKSDASLDRAVRMLGE